MNTLLLARKFRALNKPLFFLMLGLLVFGVYAIYSATWMRDTPFWTSQIRWILICLPVFFLVNSILDLVAFLHLFLGQLLVEPLLLGLLLYLSGKSSP